MPKSALIGGYQIKIGDIIMKKIILLFMFCFCFLFSLFALEPESSFQKLSQSIQNEDKQGQINEYKELYQEIVNLRKEINYLEQKNKVLQDNQETIVKSLLNINEILVKNYKLINEKQGEN